MALIAAYALALQALLAGLAFTTDASHASLTISANCLDQTDANPPADRTGARCKLHCFIADCGFGGLAPPNGAVAAIITPADAQIAIFNRFFPPRRDPTETPQIPRAPPV